MGVRDEEERGEKGVLLVVGEVWVVVKRGEEAWYRGVEARKVQPNDEMSQRRHQIVRSL